MRSTFHHAGRTRNLPPEAWLNTIEAERYDAVIFDCDGTLIDSSDVHIRCLQAGTLAQGHKMTAKWYDVRNGMDRRSLFEAFREEIGFGFDVDRACQTSIDHYKNVVHMARPIQETINLAKVLRDRAMPLAVATNGEQPVCDLLLATIGIRDLFDTVVCISEDVPPKPSPVMFQLSAERLGHKNGKILVLEDSPQGVQAAKTAGMSVIELDAPTLKISQLN